MLKRLFILCLCAVMPFLSHISLNASIFSGYTEKVEIYLGGSGSLSQIQTIDVKDYPYFSGVCGQAFKTDLNEFDLKSFLDDFDAKVIFTESIDEGVSYYAYSPKIKERVNLNGKTINLQIFIGNSVTVGAPLIYGSF